MRCLLHYRRMTPDARSAFLNALLIISTYSFLYTLLWKYTYDLPIVRFGGFILLVIGLVGPGHRALSNSTRQKYPQFDEKKQIWWTILGAVVVFSLTYFGAAVVQYAVTTASLEDARLAAGSIILLLALIIAALTHRLTPHAQK
jgi:purine-cytosine permease-like protein